MRKDTTRLRLLTATAAAVIAGAAYAQTTDLPPERAPAAQRLAPPARIAPPMNAGEPAPGVTSETTGQSPSSVTPPKPGPVAGDRAAPAGIAPHREDAHGNQVDDNRKSDGTRSNPSP